MKVIEKLRSVLRKRLSKFETIGLSESRIALTQKKLEPILAGIFGYHALLYSETAKRIVADKLCIKNSMVLSEQPPSLRKTVLEDSKVDLVCRYQELPIASDCIDLVVLPETLQHSQTPHQILRESERVLIPEGHIILLMANPFSWMPVKQRILGWLTGNNTGRKSIGRYRLRDWFRLLGFELVSEVPVCITDKKIQQGNLYSWFKKASGFVCNYLSSYYIIVAKKKVSTMTPIRPSWRRNKKLVNPRIAEPSVRINVENCVKQIIR